MKLTLLRNEQKCLCWWQNETMVNNSCHHDRSRYAVADGCRADASAPDFRISAHAGQRNVWFPNRTDQGF